MLISFIIFFTLIAFVLYAVLGTAKGVQGRVERKEWGRLWIAGIAFAVAVACIVIAVYK